MGDRPGRAAPQRRRLRESQCRDSALIAAPAALRPLLPPPAPFVAALLLLVVLAPPAVAIPYFSVWATFGGGHDDQILAEPERRGILEAVADEFATATARLQVEWSPQDRHDRLNLSAEAGKTRYGTESVGSDSDLRLSGTYRRRLSGRFAFDGYAAWWRFRRSELNDFNVDMGRITGRFAWSPSTPWLLTATGKRNWFTFPDRPLYVDTTSATGDGEIIVIPLGDEIEEDSQTDVALSLMRRLGRGGHVALEGGYRWSDSNEASVRYRGPQVTLRLGRGLPAGLDIVGYVGYIGRRFDPYDAVQAGAEAPTLLRRRDDAWQFGFSLERPIGAGVRLLADGSWLDQRSNLDLFQFDHARVSVAVSVELWSRGRPRGARTILETPVAPFAPVVTSRGVLFRARAPRASRVSLVGDFNAWDVERTPLVRGEDGGWEVLIPLGSGIWRYAFVVDGDWRRPEDAPRYEPDGFGGENGVLEVREPAGDGAVTAIPGGRPTSESAGMSGNLRKLARR